MTTTWTRRESQAVDTWARSHANRTPLVVDPYLWELFAPFREAVRTPWDGSPCRECDSAMRSAGVLIADAPGTRPHAGKGLCRTCSDHHRTPSRAVA